MADDTKPDKERGRWAIIVAAVLAILVSLLLVVGDLLANVMNAAFGGGRAPIEMFVWIAVLGHLALALASAFLLGAGLANAARRRRATLLAWVIIPVSIGWFFLMGRLAAG